MLKRPRWKQMENKARKLKNVVPGRVFLQIGPVRIDLK